jgi:sec-independent protein translocase protein TatB
MANGAKDRMRDEMGPDFDDVDWKKLDPRQYDPRRIIREALNDGDAPGDEKEQSASISRSGPNPEGAYLQRKRSAERAAGTYSEPAPFDSEAT